MTDKKRIRAFSFCARLDPKLNSGRIILHLEPEGYCEWDLECPPFPERFFDSSVKVTRLTDGKEMSSDMKWALHGTFVTSTDLFEILAPVKHCDNILKMFRRYLTQNVHLKARRRRDPNNVLPQREKRSVAI